MRTIGHEELKQKLDRQDPFRLVMALGEWAYDHPDNDHWSARRSMRLSYLLYCCFACVCLNGRAGNSG